MKSPYSVNICDLYDLAKPPSVVFKKDVVFFSFEFEVIPGFS